MKIRKCFVSNSSSVSFVIAKAYMTDEQIKKFRDFISFIEDYVDENVDVEHTEFQKYVDDLRLYSEGQVTPNEEGKYFIGVLDQHIALPRITEFLTDIGVDKDDWAIDH